MSFSLTLAVVIIALRLWTASDASQAPSVGLKNLFFISTTVLKLFRSWVMGCSISFGSEQVQTINKWGRSVRQSYLAKYNAHKRRITRVTLGRQTLFYTMVGAKIRRFCLLPTQVRKGTRDSEHEIALWRTQISQTENSKTNEKQGPQVLSTIQWESRSAMRNPNKKSIAITLHWLMCSHAQACPWHTDDRRPGCRSTWVRWACTTKRLFGLQSWPSNL